MIQILLVQGADMAWLGRREPEIYGSTTAAELDEMMLARALERGVRARNLLHARRRRGDRPDLQSRTLDG